MLMPTHNTFLITAEISNIAMSKPLSISCQQQHRPNPDMIQLQTTKKAIIIPFLDHLDISAWCTAHSKTAASIQGLLPNSYTYLIY